MTIGAPIYDAINEYLAENNLRLHMPGHIGGRSMPSPFSEMASLDLTEVPGLDDFHAPDGAIARARELLAAAYGADESFFLVNGATSGIHALFLSLPEEAVVVVPRNAHRSFFGAMVLSGAHPVYLTVQVHPEIGTGLAVTTDEMARVLILQPRVDAVFVTSPSYYGTTCEITRLAELAHQQGAPLYVDEAHGGHFPFHPDYPGPAIQAGADAVVNGLHKTLPVLNQGACLHLGGGLPGEAAAQAISLITTTSPSYPILASIDLARQFMVVQGRGFLEKAAVLSQRYRNMINEINGLHCYTEEEMRFVPGVDRMDPLKLFISVRGLYIDGYGASRWLRQYYGVQLEAADATSILAMMSMLHQEAEWERFYRALVHLAKEFAGQPKYLDRGETPPAGRMVLTPRRAFYARKQRVPLSRVAGRIAGEMVAAYPPGIPCVFPGEIITEEIYEYLCYLKNSAVSIQGPSQPGLESLLVIDD
ncbi:MAG: aminotransferase class I/II-fold pyridoxal phosphate-dependent enzyme [Syntrophomonadaceae bacterium]|nr:aminotransferase class I/II-fold pyridoxal phosphate-dependent enzyme [Syntrophomonadaceae bacterium]